MLLLHSLLFAGAVLAASPTATSDDASNTTLSKFYKGGYSDGFWQGYIEGDSNSTFADPYNLSYPLRSLSFLDDDYRQGYRDGYTECNSVGLDFLDSGSNSTSDSLTSASTSVVFPSASTSATPDSPEQVQGYSDGNSTGYNDGYTNQTYNDTPRNRSSAAYNTAWTGGYQDGYFYGHNKISANGTSSAFSTFGVDATGNFSSLDYFNNYTYSAQYNSGYDDGQRDCATNEIYSTNGTSLKGASATAYKQGYSDGLSDGYDLGYTNAIFEDFSDDDYFANYTAVNFTVSATSVSRPTQISASAASSATAKTTALVIPSSATQSSAPASQTVLIAAPFAMTFTESSNGMFPPSLDNPLVITDPDSTTNTATCKIDIDNAPLNVPQKCSSPSYQMTVSVRNTKTSWFLALQVSHTVNYSNATTKPAGVDGTVVKTLAVTWFCTTVQCLYPSIDKKSWTSPAPVGWVGDKVK